MTNRASACLPVFLPVTLLAATMCTFESRAAAAPTGKEAVTRYATLGDPARSPFRAPETVIWDEREDRYLVSNMNGRLTVYDDNGFISRVMPNGQVENLKWIDGAALNVTLHAPKDMLLTDEHLVVADLGAVHYFDRTTGTPVRAVVIPDSHMLNALALHDDGKTVYVTDTGGRTDEEPGAIYRIPPDEDAKAMLVARGPELKRPNGVLMEQDALLYAPFGQHASHLYRLSPGDDPEPAVKLPDAQLDGLLRLPDDSLIVTSWKGKAVYHVTESGIETLLEELHAPAQPGYDAKRNRLLVPLPMEHLILVHPLTVDE